MAIEMKIIQALNLKKKLLNQIKSDAYILVTEDIAVVGINADTKR